MVFLTHLKFRPQTATAPVRSPRRATRLHCQESACQALPRARLLLQETPKLSLRGRFPPATAARRLPATPSMCWTTELAQQSLSRFHRQPSDRILTALWLEIGEP